MVDPRTQFERLIPFETVFNFRDLGGYPAAGGRATRWRRLFRADGLNRLGPDDAEQFGELGIATVVDLRTSDEVDSGRIPAEVAEVIYHHLPMFDVLPDWNQTGDVRAEGFLADRYVEMLTTGRHAVATTLELLADPTSYPLVFHCAAGKDRTGIVAGIVLSLLGVDDEVIVADYALSGQAMDRLMAWGRANSGAFKTPRAEVPAAAIESRPETMARFLDQVRLDYGSVSGLARDLGVADDVVDRIRAHLLEDLDD
jgi:protein-tyrosine phosphatase